MINLDTHVLIFALAGEVSVREAKILGKNRWSISAIVLWELAKLVQLKRVGIDLEDAETVRIVSALHVWPIDLEIASESTRLDFKGDPADELIAATSVVHRIPLLTRDKRMRGSRVVPFA